MDGVKARSHPTALASSELSYKTTTPHTDFTIINNTPLHPSRGICGLVVEFIVAIDETRVRFPADALFYFYHFRYLLLLSRTLSYRVAPLSLSVCLKRREKKKEKRVKFEFKFLLVSK